MESHEFETLQTFFNRGGSLRILADVNQTDLDKLYQYASQLYQAADIQGAKRIFYLLARIDQWKFDYWLSLGICYQQLAEHKEAIFCFSRSGMIWVDDPRSAYYAALSYQSVGNTSYAAKGFNAALRWCNTSPKWAHLRNGIEQGLASVQKI